MLKIVKKLERKQYMANMVTEAVLKMRAGERLLLMSNTVRINTGEYRLLSDTSQKLKKDWLKGGPMPIIQPNMMQGKRPSVFSRAASNIHTSLSTSAPNPRLTIASAVSPNTAASSRPSTVWQPPWLRIAYASGPRTHVAPSPSEPLAADAQSM